MMMGGFFGLGAMIGVRNRRRKPAPPPGPPANFDFSNPANSGLSALFGG